MATRIRLKRIGRRNRPFYRVVVMDSRQRRDGAAIEEIGWYNPISIDKENNYELNEERVFHWLKNGAQPSEIAHKLMKRAGISFKWHLMKQGLNEKAIEKELQKLELRREAQAKEKLDSAAQESKKKAREDKKEEVKETGAEEPKAEKVESEKTEKSVEEKVEVKAEAKDEVNKEAVSEKTDEKEVADVEKEEATAEESTPQVKAEKEVSAEKAESQDEVIEEAKDDK